MTSKYHIPWLYRPAVFDTTLLNSYKIEVLKMIKEQVGSFDNLHSQFRLLGSTEHIKKNCPSLVEALTNLGLIDMFWTVGIIVVHKDWKFEIHVDTVNPARNSVGLNIPVMNCAGSDTVFYDVKEIQYERYPSNYLIGSEAACIAVPCSDEGAVEIDRCSANAPHWLNVAAPHKPICDHTNLRINSSIRFTHEIFDVINSPRFEAELVRK